MLAIPCYVRFTSFLFFFFSGQGRVGVVRQQKTSSSFGDQFLTHCSVTQRYAAAIRAVWLALLSARAYRMLTGACYPTLRPIPVSLLDLGFDSRFFFCLKAVRLAQLDGNLPWPWSWPRVSDLPPSRRPSRRVAHLSARSSLPTRSPTHSTKRARLQTRALNGGRGDGNRTA